MKTSKSLSTISYNTTVHLENILSLLIEDGIVYEYFYILHYGEGCDKDHIHLFLSLCKSVDTSSLRDRFTEPSPIWYEPDLGCMPFLKSDFNNWLLYSLHDETYLMLKKEVKYFHYDLSDVYTNSECNIGNCYRDAYDKICNTDNMQILDKLQNGFTPSQLIKQGYNPQVISTIFKMVQAEGLYENTYLQQRISNERLKSDIRELRKNENFVNMFLTNIKSYDTYSISDLNIN